MLRVSTARLQPVVLVTGATGVIGSAVTRKLAGSGYSVVAAGRNDARLAPLRGVASAVHTCSFATQAECDALVKAACGHAADGGLAGVVCCTGATQNKLLLRAGDNDFTDMYDANVLPVMRVTKAALRLSPMLKAGDGAFVALGSYAGEHGNAGQAAYAASKAALSGAYKSLAKEYGRKGIRFNVVAPGLIESDMADTIPAQERERWAQASALGRLGTANEVAEVVLAALRSRYVTGQVLPVNGGA